MFSPIKIQVPATSANLGPGFDVLGLAVKFYNRFEATPSKEAETLTVSIAPGTCVDVSEMSLNPDENLLAKSYSYYFKQCQQDVISANLAIEGHIPLARGLGSSSSAIVGGLFLANAVNQDKLPKSELLKMAVELEGHPDNVTPAMFGGVQYCLPDKSHKALHWPIDWELIFIIPPTPLETKKARSVLPQKYAEHQLDAAHKNLLSWLIAVQTGDIHKMKTALVSDVLHEPYRRPLIPEYAIVAKAIEHSKALGCVISGAGSTLLVVTHDNFLQDTLMRLKNDPKLSHCTVTHLKIDTEGVKAI